MQRPLAPATSRGLIAPVLRDVRAVVFDTDGVITDSARVHAAAWKAAFDAYLRAHPPEDPDRRRLFDVRDDYPRYVDGKSRLDGAAAFLAARGIETSPETVRAVAADKERLLVQRLNEHGVDAYPGTVRLVRALRRAGVPRAAAPASRHAGELLEPAGVLDLFDVLVDGGEAARLGLAGKPGPDLFLEAVRRLGVPADRAAVVEDALAGVEDALAGVEDALAGVEDALAGVEDALAGVEAGRRGGFALVIGVDRIAGDDTGARLLRRGADIVVRDLGELCGGGAPK